MRSLIPAIFLFFLAACQQEQASAGNEAASGGAAAEAGKGAPPVGPEGIPQFKAGAWEVTKHEDGKEPEIERYCAGEDGQSGFQQLASQFSGGGNPDCQPQRSSGPDGIKMSAQCKQGNLTLESALTLTGTETSYELDMSTGVILASGERKSGGMKVSGRHIGECPAGAVPGQKIGEAR